MITGVPFLEWWYMVTVVFKYNWLFPMPLWHFAFKNCIVKDVSSQMGFFGLFGCPTVFASGCAWSTEPWVGSFVSPEAFGPWRCGRVDRQHWSSSKRYAAAGAESESLPGAAVWCGSLESFFFLETTRTCYNNQLAISFVMIFELPSFSLFFYIIIELCHQIFFKDLWHMLLYTMLFYTT